MSATADRPEIVVLCGSTRFYEEFQRVNYDLTMAGKIVLSVGFYPHAKAQHGHGEGVGHDSAEKEALDELHKRKIDLADRVYVINPDGYLGTSTRCEIRYAWSVAHKPVEFMWTMPDEHHDGRMHGLCVHGEPRGTCPGIESYRILCDHDPKHWPVSV